MGLEELPKVQKKQEKDVAEWPMLEEITHHRHLKSDAKRTTGF